VLEQARQWVLAYYTNLVTTRNRRHQAYLAQLHQQAHYYRTPVDPLHLQRTEHELHLGINDDWRRSVRLYPQVLDHFHNQVIISYNEESELDSETVVMPPSPQPARRRRHVEVEQERYRERSRRRTHVPERRFRYTYH
jgi:hypothetical protein